MIDFSLLLKLYHKKNRNPTFFVRLRFAFLWDFFTAPFAYGCNGIRTRREQAKLAEENSPADCFCRRGQGAKRREGVRKYAEKIPDESPEEDILLDAFFLMDVMEFEQVLRGFYEKDYCCTDGYLLFVSLRVRSD
ncbi:MAG: hypothetical protein MJ168_07135 [Clostridia bacterium]|nr:hypothetical protein [Clostridia bacterium]